MSDGTIKMKKSTLMIWVLVILLVVSVFTKGFGLFGDKATGQAVNNPNNNPNNIPTGTVSVNAQDYVDDDPMLGDQNAKLTIVEFSDYQCPFCARVEPTVKQIIDEYVTSGKVRFVYRDFPLTSIHQYAQISAEASECADEQSKFWEYHDVLFENQASLEKDSLKKYANDLGLDSGKFNECLDSGKYKSEVNKDSQDAQKVGGQGTPYFLVGEIPVSGAQPYENFKQAIEAQL